MNRLALSEWHDHISPEMQADLDWYLACVRLRDLCAANRAVSRAGRSSRARAGWQTRRTA
jgi:hypothetical protein